jgi:hypothetical protein
MMVGVMAMCVMAVSIAEAHDEKLVSYEWRPLYPISAMDVKQAN